MKIICIGRNYAKHAKEMKSEIPTEPVFFLKPDTAVLKDDTFYYPDFSSDIHYECEVVVKISRMGKHISEEFAHKYYEKIGLGIDFTARDLQKKCKEKGLPWEIAKGFDQSAVVSKEFIDKSELNLEELHFSLHRNNECVQNGSSTDMVFSIDQVIAYLSKFITLKVGDLIFTGTPEGVGPIQKGDRLLGKLEDKTLFDIHIK